MSDWLLDLPVLWMGVVILVAIYAFSAALYLAITALAVGERGRAFKAISPGMLPPLAIIFALNRCVPGRAGLERLRSGEHGGQPGSERSTRRDSPRRRVSGRARHASARSYPAPHSRRGYSGVAGDGPSQCHADACPAPVVGGATAGALAETRGEGQVAAQREIVASLMNALEARRQRIILSATSINWVKWTVLLVQAGLTLLVVGLIHSDNRAANRIIMAVFATAVGIAVVLIASHSRPFSGQLAVRPTVLLQVMPEATAPAGNAPP